MRYYTTYLKIRQIHSLTNQDLNIIMKLNAFTKKEEEASKKEEKMESDPKIQNSINTIISNNGIMGNFHFSGPQLLILLAIIIISALAGYFIGYSRSSQTNVKETMGANIIKTSPLFQFQTAIIPDGKITALEDNVLTVQNDQNQKGEFPLSKSLAIYKPLRPDSPEGTSSSDIKSIELNQKATVVLNFTNGQFEVTEISYIPQSGQ